MSQRSEYKKFRHVMAAVYGTPWAILPSKLDQIVELIELRASGRRFTAEEIAARIGDAGPPAMSLRDSAGHIAVLNLYGTIFHRADMVMQISGGTSALEFGRVFDEVIDDDSVASILINVDSPGGAVPGVQELADKIYAARGTKPIVALVDPMAASAAYWIASQADELIAVPSAVAIGSIGVLSVHTDRSKANEKAGIKRTYIQSVEKKAQFNPDKPLSKQDLAEAEDQVKQIHRTFVAHVARGRGVSTAEVNSSFGSGRTFLAAEALTLGMVDRIATFDDVVGELAAGGREPGVPAVRGRHQPAFGACAPSADPERFRSISHLL